MDDSRISGFPPGLVDPDLADLYPKALEKISKEIPEIISLIENDCLTDALRMTKTLRGVASLFGMDDFAPILNSSVQKLEAADLSVKNQLELVLKQSTHRLSLTRKAYSAL